MTVTVLTTVPFLVTVLVALAVVVGRLVLALMVVLSWHRDRFLSVFAVLSFWFCLR